MPLSKLLRKEAILIDSQIDDKWKAIEKLLDLLVAIDSVPKENRETVQAALFAREKSMSTGMEKGIAIPHAAVDGVNELAIALGVLPKGVTFESIDGKPASVVVLLVIPKAKKLVHIRTLADVARLLSHDSLRKKILEAKNPAAVLNSIKEEEAQQLGQQ